MTELVVVGFTGLGAMAGKMATNIQKAGYKLILQRARERYSLSLRLSLDYRSEMRQSKRKFRRAIQMMSPVPNATPVSSASSDGRN